MNLSEIEKNKKFKYYIFNKDVWKNYAFVPPSLVLFGGLFGLLFLFQNDKLMSWYSLPFIIIFAIGTVWFKSTRKYLIDKKIKDLSSFVVCPTIHLTDINKQSILLFSTDRNRYNLDYLKRKKKEILENKEDIDKIYPTLKKNGFSILPGSDNYLITNKLKNEKAKNNKEDVYVVFIDNMQVRLVSKHIISKFLTQKK